MGLFDCSKKSKTDVREVKWSHLEKEKRSQFRFGEDAQISESDDQQRIAVTRRNRVAPLMTSELLAAWDEAIQRKERFMLMPTDGFKADALSFRYVLTGKNDASKEFRSLSRAVIDPKFPLPYRIAAGINLAEAVKQMEQIFRGFRSAIHPDSFVVNIATGDVYCLPDYWLEGLPDSYSGYNCYDPPEWYAGGTPDTLKTPQAIRHFLAVAEFRLLCADDPFEDDNTLWQYPCLTRETKKQIYGEKSCFLFSEPKRPNQFTGIRAGTQWERYPAYLREFFLHSLSEGIKDAQRRVSLREWLYALRRLRDCLIPKDREYRFLDPDTYRFTVSNETFHGFVLNLRTTGGEYAIPMCPQKAVYWYHADLPPDFASAGERGMIGAALPSAQNPSALTLQNRCKLPWFLVMNDLNKRKEIPFRSSIPLDDNMKLILPAVASDRSVEGIVEIR